MLDDTWQVRSGIIVMDTDCVSRTAKSKRLNPAVALRTHLCCPFDRGCLEDRPASAPSEHR